MNLKNHFKYFLIVTLLFSSSIFLELRASSNLPDVTPDGWVAEEITIELSDYLRSQYAYARKKELISYVYIYSDRNDHCKRIRTLMKRDDMKGAFKGTYIVMINYSDLKKLSKNNTSFGRNFTPIIAKISQNGTISRKSIAPELYLYYPLKTGVRELKKYSIVNKWLGPVPTSVFAKQLKKFFETSDGT